MKPLLLAVSLLTAAPAAQAASVTNRDPEPRTILVTEGTGQVELVVRPNQTADFCEKGCFVTLPNGDREALTGGEAIEIVGGRARIN